MAAKGVHETEELETRLFINNEAEPPIAFAI
jgi:hypothetical protein